MKKKYPIKPIKKRYNPSSNSLKRSPKFIAWHIITGGKKDFKAILADKAIKPAESRKISQQIYPIDDLAGDSHYVFLAAVPYNTQCYFPEEAIWQLQHETSGCSHIRYAFGFDLMQLLQNGSLVGTRDLISGYNEVGRKILKEHASQVLPQSLRGLINSKCISDCWIDLMNQHSTEASQLVELLNSNPTVKNSLKKAFTKLQKQYRFAGKSAIKLISKQGLDCWNKSKCVPFSHLEILHPGDLSLDKAIYKIEEDKLYQRDVQNQWEFFTQFKPKETSEGLENQDWVKLLAKEWIEASKQTPTILVPLVFNPYLRKGKIQLDDPQIMISSKKFELESKQMEKYVASQQTMKDYLNKLQGIHLKIKKAAKNHKVPFIEIERAIRRIKLKFKEG